MAIEDHYKKAWALGDAIEFMRNERSRHFDPGCVAALLRRLNEVMDIQKEFAEEDASASVFLCGAVHG